MSFLSSFLGGAGGAVVGNLVVSIVADTTGLKAGFNDAKQSAKGFADAILSGKGLKNALGAIGPAAVAGVAVAGIAAIGAVMVDSTAKAVEFQKSMAAVMTQLPGAGKEVEEELTSVIRDLQTELGVASSESLPAMYDALSAGISENDIAKFMETSSKMAIGGLIDMGTAVDGLTSAVNAYGSDVLDVESASDILFTTIRLGKVDMSELATSLSNVTPLAAAAGVGLDQVGAAVATLTMSGTKTSVATNQMKALLNELIKSGSTADVAFRKIFNGQNFTEYIAAGGDLQTALTKLSNAAAGAEKTALDNLRNVSTQYQAVKKEYDAAKQAVDEAQDAYDNAKDEREKKAAQEQLKNAKKNLKQLADPMKDLEKDYSYAQDAAEGASKSIIDVFGSIEAGAAALTLTTSGSATFADALQQMGDAAGATDQAFETMDNTVSRRMEKIGVKMDSFMERIGEKILPVVEDVILPAIEGVMGFLDMLFGKIDDGTAQNVLSFHPLFGVFETLKQWWEENGETVIAGCAVIWDTLVSLWTQIEPYVTAAMDVLNTIIDTGLGTILDIITLVFALIAGDNEKAGELIYSINFRLMKNLGTLIENGVNTALEFIETSLNNLLKFATKIANSLIDVVEDALNAAVGWANDFIDAWNELAMLTGLPTIGFDFDEVKLPDLTAPEIELPRVTMISDKISELEAQYEKLLADQRAAAGDTVTDNSVTNTKINLTQNIITNTPADAWIDAGKEMNLNSLGGGGRG